ncbi:hypothetical protein [Occallatibacter savannae]|uniref:Mom family adenine methylcarbamoylation protein n=1 Tax=Occallatibacter savannae TaxID=1002691 RepID=UPI000D697478|nr:hypothetical protein [Occallatibacter savannae]
MKCHQREIRESAPPEPDEDIKRALAQDFAHACVREITHEQARPLILKYEWLRSMGSGRKWFGLFFGEHLGGCEGFGATGGTRVWESVAGVEHADRVCELVRGTCLPWTPKNSASWLIRRACEQMAELYNKNLFIAYATESAGECGVIYSSLNWQYAGYTRAAQVFVLDGKIHDSRQISGLARDRRGHKQGEPMRYRRTWAEQKQLLTDQGAVFLPGERKHKFIGLYGTPAIVKQYRRALKLPSLPYPRRAD